MQQEIKNMRSMSAGAILQEGPLVKEGAGEEGHVRVVDVAVAQPEGVRVLE